MESRKGGVMQIRLIGAIMVVIGCSAFGFILAAMHKREVRTLRQLICVLDYMECELQYRLTPLPDLMRQSALESGGVLRTVFSILANELEDQISPNVAHCMHSALVQSGDIPSVTVKCLTALGQTLGRFDLQGQLNGLDAVRQMCRGNLDVLERDKQSRLRCYQTLGVCAGAAIAVLLI